MRGALVGAGLALVAGVLAGCSDAAPDDASEEEFCDAFGKLGTSGTDFDKNMDAFKDLEDTGTPDDIPDDAREGFEIVIDTADEADNQEDAAKAFEDLSQADEKKVTSFFTYTIKKCSDLPSLPSDLPSVDVPDLPSDVPSDLPSDLPSELTDIPSDLLSPTS